MARENDSWVQEREKMKQEREKLRLRLELNEIRTKSTEKMLAAIATKLGISKGATSVGEGNAYGWVQKLERYFTLKAISEEERVQATMVALEGRALSWYQWWEHCNQFPTWESFKIAVVRRFQPSMIQNPFELLLSLKQEGSVEAYVEEFEKYAGALQKINPYFVRGVFLNGLKEEIRVEMRLHELETLPEGYVTTAGPYRSSTYNRAVSLDSSTTSNKTKCSSVGSVAGASRIFQEVESSKSMGEYRRLTSA
ncbi:hypothetical protein Lal_00016761 [Lupinus albus]|nr:hypothetical protein Lal_00016761 [Lupinus albus]